MENALANITERSLVRCIKVVVQYIFASLIQRWSQIMTQVATTLVQRFAQGVRVILLLDDTSFGMKKIDYQVQVMEASNQIAHMERNSPPHGSSDTLLEQFLVLGHFQAKRMF